MASCTYSSIPFLVRESQSSADRSEAVLRLFAAAPDLRARVALVLSEPGCSALEDLIPWLQSPRLRAGVREEDSRAR